MPESIRPLDLYEITAELEDLEQALLESGGVITEELEERYGRLLEMEAEKVEGYVAMIRKFAASEEAIKAERKRLQKAERSMRRAAQNLKDRLAEAMQQRGEDTYETKLGKVRLQQAARRSVALDVDDADLPDRFRRVKVSPDKQALIEALESEDLELRREAEHYAHLDAPSYYVRIY